MKGITAAAVVLSLVGCAIVEDPALTPIEKPFRPIEAATDAKTVKHGVVTVRQVQQRSDIIIVPPSMQHVVWVKETGPIVSTETIEARPRTEGTTPAIEGTKRRVKDNWPLLAEDLNFDSEIGRVDMCSRRSACLTSTGCAALEPCENPEQYDCYTVKQGEYCLEAHQ